MDNDLPMTRLAEMFNVNHFIVSQVNPHVVPFLAREEDAIAAEAQQKAAFSATSTWIHDLANFAKEEASHRLQFLSELGILPNYLTKARSVINQRYSGDITIFPAISYSQFPNVLRNPTPEFMQQCLLTGERATWPKLSRIQNHLAIELALDDTLRQLRARAVFSAEQPHVRFNNPTQRPRTHHGEPSRVSGHRVTTSLTTTGLPYSLPPISPTKRHQLVRLPSSHGTRSSQSLGLTRTDILPIPTDPLSPSPNEDVTSSDEMAAESDTSTSPSRPDSPPSNLWPNNRHLFPFASQPATPGPEPSYVAHRRSSFLTLDEPAGSTAIYPNRYFHRSDPISYESTGTAQDTLPTELLPHVEKTIPSAGDRPWLPRQTGRAPGLRQVSSGAVRLTATDPLVLAEVKMADAPFDIAGDRPTPADLESPTKKRRVGRDFVVASREVVGDGDVDSG